MLWARFTRFNTSLGISLWYRLRWTLKAWFDFGNFLQNGQRKSSLSIREISLSIEYVIMLKTPCLPLGSYDVLTWGVYPHPQVFYYLQIQKLMNL